MASLIALSLAWAGFTVTVPPVAWRVGECLVVRIEVENRTPEPLDLALGAPAFARGRLDGETLWIHQDPCPVEDGPRVVVAPGETRVLTWTGWRDGWGRSGLAELTLGHVDLGELRVPVAVEVPESQTPAAWARHYASPRDALQFQHPTFLPELIPLAEQGLDWAVDAVAAQRGHPVADAALARLREHPNPVVLDRIAARHPVPRDRSVGEPRPDPVPDLAGALHAASTCDPRALDTARRRMFEAGRREELVPVLLRCLETADLPARRPLLRYVAWSAVRCEADADPAAVRLWARVFALHAAAVAADRQLPTEAEGVPQAVAALRCAAVPSSAP